MYDNKIIQNKRIVLDKYHYQISILKKIKMTHKKGILSDEKKRNFGDATGKRTIFYGVLATRQNSKRKRSGGRQTFQLQHAFAFLPKENAIILVSKVLLATNKAKAAGSWLKLNVCIP